MHTRKTHAIARYAISTVIGTVPTIMMAFTCHPLVQNRGVIMTAHARIAKDVNCIWQATAQWQERTRPLSGTTGKPSGQFPKVCPSIITHARDAQNGVTKRRTNTDGLLWMTAITRVSAAFVAR